MVFFFVLLPMKRGLSIMILNFCAVCMTWVLRNTYMYVHTDGMDCCVAYYLQDACTFPQEKDVLNGDKGHE
jgi:hypothetical protein